MSMECLILTNDSNLLGQLQAGLGTHGTALHHRQDSASAIELASRRHLDGLMIDCDDVPGATGALALVRSAAANRQTPVVAVVNGLTSGEAALDLGANFVLTKPIQQSRLQSVLQIAVAKMEREHRRYFRYEVDLPLQFRSPLGQSLTANMKNISEGGLAIQLASPLPLKGVVIVEFELPSVKPQTFHAKADVVWRDSFVVGMRFLYIEKVSGIGLQAWLASLESQSRFREPGQRLR